MNYQAKMFCCSLIGDWDRQNGSCTGAAGYGGDRVWVRWLVAMAALAGEKTVAPLSSEETLSRRPYRFRAYWLGWLALAILGCTATLRVIDHLVGGVSALCGGLVDNDEGVAAASILIELVW